MKKNKLLKFLGKVISAFSLMVFLSIQLNAQSNLVITGIVDGDLTGGLPKAIELYVINDIADLSAYGIGSANNGGGSDGEEFTLSGSATADDYIYIATEEPEFEGFFGFKPDFTANAASINGDDAVELFHNSAVVDVYGDINVNGDGEPWDYTDGWAYRKPGTGPDGSTWTESNWTFSGLDGLSGETSNATAANPVPVGTYGGSSVDPEPENHVTGLSAHDVSSSQAWIQYTGAADGTQPPAAYLLVCVDTDATDPTVADGTAIADDFDISDDVITINVPHQSGDDTIIITDLEPGKSYDISVYPYTNSGADIDYKLVPPTVQLDMRDENVTIIAEDFEAQDFGAWDTINEASDKSWYVNEYNDNYFAEISGFEEDEPSKDWLISPEIDFSQYTNEYISFLAQYHHGDNNDEIEVVYATDYSGDVTAATWVPLGGFYNVSGSWYEWLENAYDLSGIPDGTAHVAIKYYSDGGQRGWRIDSLKIAGFENDVTPPSFTMSTPKISNLTDVSMNLVVALDEPGTVFYKVQNDGDPAPAINDIMNEDTIEVAVADQKYMVNIDTLSAEKTYDIYFVAQDDEPTPNVQADSVVLDANTLMTRELTITQPVAGESVYMGDTLYMKWDADNIDSLRLFADFYIESLHLTGEWFDSVIYNVDADSLMIAIPQNASTDSVRFILADANDTTFSDSVGMICFIDTFAPQISRFEPVNNATDVLVDIDEFLIVMNEVVQKGEGNITLHKASNDEVVETWNVDTLDIIFLAVSLDLHENLEYDMQYYFMIDSMAFRDIGQDTIPFAGIDDNNTWTFTTISEFEIAPDIATLRTGATDGTVYKLTGEAILTYQQSFRNKKYIQDATAGIEIDDNDGNITTVYNIADGITGIVGTLNEHNGMMQFIPEAGYDPGAATSTGNTITPVTVTVADYNANIDDYEGEVVKIENCDFDDAGGVFSTGTNYSISVGGGNDVVLRTAFYDANYIDSLIPDNSDVIGIAFDFNGTAQITPRSMDDIPAAGGEITVTDVADIATLRSSGAGVFRITGEVIVTHTMSYRNKKYVQDATGAIEIDDNNDVITTSYNVGDGITNLSGTLGDYNGMMQLVPTAGPGAASSTGNVVTPLKVSISELAANFDDYEAELLVIDSVTFQSTGTFSGGNNYDLSDGSNTLTFRTNDFDADYIDGNIPDVMLNVTGLAIEFSGTPQIFSRSSADMDTVETQVQPYVSEIFAGVAVYPNPAKNALNIMNIAQIKMITITSIDGRNIEMLKNSGSNQVTIDVSAYSSGLYMITMQDADNSKATLKFVKQ